MRVIWLAAAACLLVAVLLPPRLAPQPSGTIGPVSLTPDEAAEIVAAYVTLSWDSPLDYTLDAVDVSLDGIERALRREAGSTTLLPWSNDDDWDVPAAMDESQPQSQVPGGVMCFAGSRCRYDG